MTADWHDHTDYRDCPCCGQPLAGFVQPMPRRTLVQVTCFNEACRMLGFTMSPQQHKEECEKAKAKA